MKNSKKLLLLVAIIALVASCGEIVSSIHPFYTPGDVVYDPTLIGEWAEVGSTNQSGGGLIFQKLEKNNYLMHFPLSESETLYFIAHLFEIKGKRFLDTQLTNRSEWVPNGHLLWKIDQITPTLKMALLEHEWLKGMLKTNPKAIQHRIDHKRTNDSEGTIVLIEDTKELQEFILKYAADTNAFPKAKPLQKVGGQNL